MQAADGLIDELAQQSGAMKFAVRRDQKNSDGSLTTAMAQASERVGEVRHPDEPDEPLASYVSEVQVNNDFVWFSADISDMEEEPMVLNEIVDAILAALSAHGIDTTLETFES